MLGSIGCAASRSLDEFVLARIVQGMGGAMMTPVGRLIMVRSIDKKNLLNAMSLVTMPALIGPICGPPLGGFITTYASWHWIFLINVPIGLVGIVLASRYIANVRVEHRDPFDFLGFVLSGLAIAGLAFGLSAMGLEFLPVSVGRGADLRRRHFGGGLRHSRQAHAGADPRSQSAAAADIPRQHLRRLSVPARHRRAAVPAAAAAANRLQSDAVSVRPHYLHHARSARCS